ncbi:hypothetical protein AYO47_08370 [Planctomyces sp. SCGC AG-212-M04]|nr:hypothetical protein AYO47_08370 [Planctomyces sp. SCGC AG-212-M04]
MWQLLSRASRRLSALLPLAYGVSLILVLVTLVYSGTAYALALMLIVGCCTLPAVLWVTSGTKTMPLLAFLSLQDTLWYGLPLIVHNKKLAPFDDDEILWSAATVALYSLSLAAAGAVMRRVYVPPNERALRVAIGDYSTRRRIRRATFLVLIGAIVIEWLLINGTIGRVLGAYFITLRSAIHSILAVGEASAALYLAHELGRGRLSSGGKWLLICLIATLSLMRVLQFLLSSSILLLAAVILGLFLGGLRIPWKTIIGVTLVFSVLNVGKFEMRAKYWSNKKLDYAAPQIHEIPGYLGEWVNDSFRLMFSDDRHFVSKEAKHRQGLSERISHLEMVAYVNRRLNSNYSLLLGETYSQVPFVLVPRVLWQDKPRGHIAQEILSVHFGLQNREQTWTTYIAWGQVPEAIGNFGPLFGPIAIGVFLGIVLGAVEKWTSVTPLLSVRGIAAGILTLNVISITENSSTVIVSTAVQQMSVALATVVPFLSRKPIARRADSGRIGLGDRATGRPAEAGFGRPNAGMPSNILRRR